MKNFCSKKQEWLDYRRKEHIDHNCTTDYMFEEKDCKFYKKKWFSENRCRFRQITYLGINCNCKKAQLEADKRP